MGFFYSSRASNNDDTSLKERFYMRTVRKTCIAGAGSFNAIDLHIFLIILMVRDSFLGNEFWVKFSMRNFILKIFNGMNIIEDNN